MGSLSWIAPCKHPLPAVFVCFGEMPEVSELSSCVLWVGFSITTHLSVGGDKSGKARAGRRLHVPTEGFWAKGFGQDPPISAPSNMSWKWGIARRGNRPQGYNEILNWASTSMSAGQQCWEKLPGVVTDVCDHRASRSSHLSPVVWKAGTSFPLSWTVLYCSRVFDT